MSDTEELDSFTENIMKRTLERQKLLNSDSTEGFVTKDCLNLSTNSSNSSLEDQNVLRSNDNKTNIKRNESQTQLESNPKSTDKQLIEKLLKISPNRQRVPLNQRLNSIARSYGREDYEYVDYIDSEDVDDIPVTRTARSPTKAMQRTVDCGNDSPPKRRLRLNERLNQIAKSYYPSNDFEDNRQTADRAETCVDEVDDNLNDRPITNRESPTKRPIVGLGLKMDNNFDSKVEKSSSNEMTIEKWNKGSEQTNTDQKTINESLIDSRSKSSLNAFPVQKPMETNKLKEKLTQMGYQKTDVNQKSEKLIYNSNNNKKETINCSTNVSVVCKQFEQQMDAKPENPKPENLSLRAKTHLFEKAILAENEAKSRQYQQNRKRNAPVVKPIQPTVYAVPVNNRVVEPKPETSYETEIKRQKSSEKLGPTVGNVSNNIEIRKQLLEERLFGSETTTANAYKKELESRQKELESLKRPLKTNQSKQQMDINSIVENPIETEISEPKDHSFESVDNETAHQTVCEAFHEIESLSNEDIDNEVLYEKGFNCNVLSSSSLSDSKAIVDKDLNIGFESPTKKNRLYPQLFDIEESVPEPEWSPPAKPPRVYEPTPASNTTPLRTISFYRREQSLKAHNTTPTVKAVVFRDKMSEKKIEFDLNERNNKIKERIDRLKHDVEQHNRIAGQASQALNLCLETNEFKGSTEQVEAERLLLLSAQKRIACLNEIQKLKQKLSHNCIETTGTKGSLTLRDFKLQLKGEFLVARVKGTVTDVHHIVCLVYNGANVFVTNVLNTESDIRNGVLEFEFGVSLSDLSNDFQIVVHIYDLITAKQHLSHELKYHIKKTPKKSKTTMKSPTVRSPGGPNAVLSTSFQLAGVVNMNLSNYYKTCFKLENFVFSSPFEGTLSTKVNLTVEHNYHLSDFFDVRDKSGFWNLRWVVLKDNNLGFWRFPEDVVSKPPIGSIDLKECINPSIGLLPTHLRHICMRPNTIPLITVANTPKNLFTKGGSIPRSRPIKYLISIENKDNGIEWSKEMSRALNNIRLWDSDASKPYSDEEFERLLNELE